MDARHSIKTRVQVGGEIAPQKEYLSLVRHYESCLAKHGDSHLGVDWPNLEDALKRYQVMLGVTRGEPCTLLDFGCGAAHLLDFLVERQLDQIAYTGLDLSEEFVSLSKKKYPGHVFYQLDILEEQERAQLPRFDYIVANGVFTEKRGMSFEDMWSFVQRMVLAVFERCDKGVAFNVMSKQVDWERDDLFHLPLDMLAWFLTKEVSRHFVIRNDYKLYEYTVYVYR